MGSLFFLKPLKILSILIVPMLVLSGAEIVPRKEYKLKFNIKFNDRYSKKILAQRAKYMLRP